MTTVFQKIIDKEIPANIIYEDDKCLGFKDIEPVAPKHFLLIPKKQIKSLQDITKEDQEIIAHMMLVIPQIAKEQDLDTDGYRVVTNIGEKAGQSVFHLHFHIIGGRALQWPPG